MRSATTAAGTLPRPGPSGPERPRRVRQLPGNAPGKRSAAERAKPRTGGTGIARSPAGLRAGPRPAPGCRRRRPSRPVRGHGTGQSPMPHPGPPVLSIASSRSTGRSGERSNRQVGLGWFGRGGAPFHVDAGRIEGGGRRPGRSPKRTARKSRSRRRRVCISAPLSSSGPRGRSPSLLSTRNFLESLRFGDDLPLTSGPSADFCRCRSGIFGRVVNRR